VDKLVAIHQGKIQEMYGYKGQRKNTNK